MVERKEEEEEEESLTTMPSTITMNATETSHNKEGRRGFCLCFLAMALFLIYTSSSVPASFTTSSLTGRAKTAETAPANTVGAAIDILEAKLADKGIAFECPASKSDNNAKVAGRLLRLPTLIELAITHAIDSTEDATEQSVGFASTCGNALVPGNVVALFSHNNHPPKGDFLRISGDDANLGRDRTIIKSLPLAFDSERFLVVNAGNGLIALYSPSHRRFLGCNMNGRLTAEGFPIVHANESPRANECFDVTISDPADQSFRLHCPIEEKYARVRSYSDFSGASDASGTDFYVVQVYGCG